MILSCSYLSMDKTVHTKSYPDNRICISYKDIPGYLDVCKVVSYCKKNHLPVVVFLADYSTRKVVEENVNEAAIATFIDMFKQNKSIGKFNYVLNKGFEEVMTYDQRNPDGSRDEDFEEVIEVFGIKFHHTIEETNNDDYECYHHHGEDYVTHYFEEVDGERSHEIIYEL